MPILYTILIILAIMVLLILVVAALLPGSYNIEKTIIIHKPVQDVMNKVGDLNNYAKWNPWQKMEPNSKQEISGTPKTAGHKYYWNGKKIGEGSLTLRDLDEKHIHFDLQFLKPWKSSGNDNWLFEEWGNTDTKVTWQNNGNLAYPIARIMGPMLSKTLNKQFDDGLKNLKALAEG